MRRTAAPPWVARDRTDSSMSPTGRHDAHVHVFDTSNPVAERRTRQVMWLTLAMMVIEIAAGTVLGSMALLADGWHMSSHALALGVSAGAYYLARRHAHDPRFAFGTWKIEVLGRLHQRGVPARRGCLHGGRVGVATVQSGADPFRRGHSGRRPRSRRSTYCRPGCCRPVTTPAINTRPRASCARSRQHGHAHHHDLNLRSAYLHVVADAATSVLAIIALAGGKYLGATWLDPVMGIVGTVLVGRWAVGLLRDTGRVLLDAEMDAPVVAEVREVIAVAARHAAIARPARVAGGAGQVRLHRPPVRRAGDARRRSTRGAGRARGTRARHGRVRALTPLLPRLRRVDLSAPPASRSSGRRGLRAGRAASVRRRAPGRGIRAGRTSARAALRPAGAVR